MSAEFEIIQPDDFHMHLRDGDVLQDTVKYASQQFGRVLVMPNLKPPVRTVEEAKQYQDRILAAVPVGQQLGTLMTLYLTDNTTVEEIQKAKESGIIYGCKLYPAGATTNSEYGVTSVNKIPHVLQCMSDLQLPLLVHGEVTDSIIDVFDKEAVFIETILSPLIANFPNLKIVIEHITTEEAVKFVTAAAPNIVATITVHHLLYNRCDIFRNGINPHMYCLPILKRETHRLALLTAATSGNPKFFIGTDSAPHAAHTKETSCGCAGIFTSHAAVELYAEAFDSVGALDKLEGFLSTFGPTFYQIPVNTSKITLRKEEWEVTKSYKFGDNRVVPLRAGQKISWKFER